MIEEKKRKGVEWRGIKTTGSPNNVMIFANQVSILKTSAVWH